MFSVNHLVFQRLLELADFVREEEMKWMHRSKDKVFLEGVSNTKFFQLKASELEF